MKSKVLRKKPKLTPARRANQARLGSITQAWSKLLTQEDRDRWNALAFAIRKKNKRIGGIHIFLKINGPRVRVGLPLLTRPPKNPILGIFNAAGLEARNQKGRFTLAVLNAKNDIEPDWYIVAATPPVGGGQKPQENDRVVIHPNATLADLAILGDAYLRTFRKRYGVPKPGQNLGLWVTQMTDGCKGVTHNWSTSVTG